MKIELSRLSGAQLLMLAIREPAMRPQIHAELDRRRRPASLRALPRRAAVVGAAQLV